MKRIAVVIFTLAFTSTLVRGQSDELMNGLQQLLVKTQNGEYQEVLSLSENMLLLVEKEFGTSDPIYAIVLSLAAGAQAEMGNPEKAEMNYKLALNGLKNAPAEYAAFTARTYFGLGRLFYGNGEYEKAEQYYLKSLPIYERTVGKEGADYANTLNDLGNLYKDLGDFGKSEKYLNQSAQIRKKLFGEKNAVYGVSLNNLASLYEKRGDYRSAALYYEQSRNIWLETLGENHPLIATTLNNYAGLYVKVGSYDDAIRFYEQALIVSEKVYGKKHDKYVTTLSNLGNVYRQMKNFDKAEQYQLQALQIRKETVGEKHIDYAFSLNNVGLIKMDKGKLDEAEKMLTESLAIMIKIMGKNHANVETTSMNLGMLYQKKGNALKAAEYFSQALGIAQNRIDHVFPVINDKEKALFYSTIQKNFEYFNYFASSNYKNNPALVADVYNYTIATKALLLNASTKIKKRILSSGDQNLIGLYNEWKDKKNMLARAWQMTADERTKNNIDETRLEQEVNEIEKKLSASSELFATHNDRTRYNWRQIQKTLKPNEAAIEIIRFNRFNFEFTDTVYYAALIIKPSSTLPEMVFFENGNFLETKLSNFYKNNIDQKQEDLKSYTFYWKPIAEKLSGVSKVYLSPDGIYNKISINSLYNPDTKKFVMDEITVQQVTNTKDLLTLPKKQSIRNAVMIGFPDYKNSPGFFDSEADSSEPISDSVKREIQNIIVPLPGTLKEVNVISSVFKNKNVEAAIFTGADATENLLKNVQSPSVLHIATHGFFLPDIPDQIENTRGSLMGINAASAGENPLLRSGILLAGAEQTVNGKSQGAEDGILTAYEAMNLNLDNTELVVLSACQTGLGEIKNGEGVYGFQRALIIAGARAVIMSLWEVDDRATQELMSEFYSLWLEGRTKRDAFAIAQNKIRKSYSHPHYWAPFILVGD